MPMVRYSRTAPAPTPSQPIALPVAQEGDRWMPIPEAAVHLSAVFHCTYKESTIRGNLRHWHEGVQYARRGIGKRSPYLINVDAAERWTKQPKR